MSGLRGRLGEGFHGGLQGIPRALGVLGGLRGGESRRCGGESRRCDLLCLQKQLPRFLLPLHLHVNLDFFVKRLPNRAGVALGGFDDEVLDDVVRRHAVTGHRGEKIDIVDRVEDDVKLRGVLRARHHTGDFAGSTGAGVDIGGTPANGVLPDLALTPPHLTHLGEQRLVFEAGADAAIVGGLDVGSCHFQHIVVAVAPERRCRIEDDFVHRSFDVVCVKHPTRVVASELLIAANLIHSLLFRKF